MLTLLIAYVGGVLTILSPCILPVLPFVFARADRPFRSHGLPMLIGMAASFAVIASLAAVGGGWVVTLNEAGRWAAIALLAVFGLTLLWPGLADRLSRPLVALGVRLSGAGDGSALSPVLLSGGRLFALMKRSLLAGESLRRVAGIAVLAGVGAIATGLDTGVLSRLSPVGTGGWEQALVDRIHRGEH